MREILLRVSPSFSFHFSRFYLPFPLTISLPILSLSFSLLLANMHFFWSNDAYAALRIARFARETCATLYRYVCVYTSVRLSKCARRECVRARAHGFAAASVWERARACVCTRRCARERFTPDYALRESRERLYELS